MVTKKQSITSLLKPKPSDFSPPVPDVMFGLAAASFRLRNLREIFIYSPDEKKRPPMRTATIKPCNQIRYMYNIFININKSVLDIKRII